MNIERRNKITKTAAFLIGLTMLGIFGLQDYGFLNKDRSDVKYIYNTNNRIMVEIR